MAILALAISIAPLCLASRVSSSLQPSLEVEVGSDGSAVRAMSFGNVSTDQREPLGPSATMRIIEEALNASSLIDVHNECNGNKNIQEPKGKIGYVFMVGAHMKNWRLWSDYFSQATGGTWKAFVHYSEEHEHYHPKIPFEHIVIPTVATEWCDLQLVQIASLEMALNDEEVIGTIFLSDSHIPLKIADHVYAELAASNMSIFKRHHNVRSKYKAEFWSYLTRDDMITLVDDYRNHGGHEIAASFVSHDVNIEGMNPFGGCVEEFYPLFALTRHRKTVEYSSRLIYLEWEPWKYFSKGEYGLPCCDLHPAEFTQLKANSFQRLLQSCSLFMRKVTPETSIGWGRERENLIQYIRREVLASKKYLPRTRQAVVFVTAKRPTNVTTKTLSLLEKLDRSKYEPYILYDADSIKTADLPKTSITAIPMHREEERSLLGKAYKEYSGRYKAPAKSAQVRWMAGQNDHQYAWFIEDDVFFNGNWNSFFNTYYHSEADLFTTWKKMKEGFIMGGHAEEGWYSWSPCDAGTATLKYHGIVALHRLSRTLAQKILDFLLEGKSGHHECVIPTLCLVDESCEMDLISQNWIGVMRNQPVLESTDLIAPNKIYHPLKEICAVGTTHGDSRKACTLAGENPNAIFAAN
mmetsp:Transcript_23986/g.47020  ORF Transcript_23986/g.47020 Transcript_23986/m.47020 type:complete len:636 (+) Transcript_23986:12-1919(+)